MFQQAHHLYWIKWFNVAAKTWCAVSLVLRETQRKRAGSQYVLSLNAYIWRLLLHSTDLPQSSVWCGLSSFREENCFTAQILFLFETYHLHEELQILKRLSCRHKFERPMLCNTIVAITNRWQKMFTLLTHGTAGLGSWGSFLSLSWYSQDLSNSCRSPVNHIEWQIRHGCFHQQMDGIIVNTYSWEEEEQKNCSKILVLHRANNCNTIKWN